MGEENSPSVKPYVVVFGGLLLLTLVTVGVAGLHLPRREAIPLGLLIAGVKAGLIAAIFMHLRGERKIVYRILYVATFFAAALMTTAVLDARHRRPLARPVQNAKVNRDANPSLSHVSRPRRPRGLSEGPHRGSRRS
ncbi:MAG: cytochrome C oxidase subunit IV family protein [Elusimicrobiota bacterium]